MQFFTPGISLFINSERKHPSYCKDAKMLFGRYVVNIFETFGLYIFLMFGKYVVQFLKYLRHIFINLGDMLSNFCFGNMLSIF